MANAYIYIYITTMSSCSLLPSKLKVSKIDKLDISEIQRVKPQLQLACSVALAQTKIATIHSADRSTKQLPLQYIYNNNIMSYRHAVL